MHMFQCPQLDKNERECFLLLVHNICLCRVQVWYILVTEAYKMKPNLTQILHTNSQFFQHSMDGISLRKQETKTVETNCQNKKQKITVAIIRMFCQLGKGAHAHALVFLSSTVDLVLKPALYSSYPVSFQGCRSDDNSQKLYTGYVHETSGIQMFKCTRVLNRVGAF